MLSESFRIQLRDHYISRLWNWITGYGIILVALGIIILFERLGVARPMKLLLSGDHFYWASIGVYIGTLIGVGASFLFSLRMKPDKLAMKADVVNLNPEFPFDADGFSEIEKRGLYILYCISRIENNEWSAASWPALLGIIWYIFGGTTQGLILYMAISLVTNLLHRPSLERTEELVEEYVSQRVQPSPNGSTHE